MLIEVGIRFIKGVYIFENILNKKKSTGDFREVESTGFLIFQVGLN